MGRTAKGIQETLEERVLDFVRKNKLVSPGEKLVVAVSGGADSVCLLHILLRLREILGIDLHLAHLDHMLRGAESQADADYVSHLAQQLNLPFTMGERDVQAYRKAHRLTLEEAAREVRYNFLAETAISIGANRVAVGHTSDDNVETILLHLIRGAGIRGLRGLLPSTEWRSVENIITVVRPLLVVTRTETTEYCQALNLNPVLDSSNLSLSPLRNRVRQQLVPLLRSYNPSVDEVLQRTAQIAGDDLAFLDEAVSKVWSEVVREGERTLILDKEGLLRLHPSLKRYLLSKAIEKLLGSLKDIEMRHIEDLMAILTKPAGKRVHLPQGLVFTVEYNRFLLGFEPAALFPSPVLKEEFPLNIPGQTIIPGWRIEASINPSQGMPKEAIRLLLDKGKEGIGFVTHGFTAYFDFDLTGSELVVRGRRRGDRFQPLGMSGEKKLGEFMIDARIPAAWRERIPIVASPQQIIWVVGWRIDERVKVTEKTKRVLCLKFKEG